MKKEYLAHLMLVFGIMIVVLIIALGVYILLSPSFDNQPKYLRMIFAGVIMTYGFYRVVTIFYKFKNKEDKQ